jgi:lipopolysaccharide/colanic/teichoic acid biosynthesis glycosyltransferase
MNGKNRIALIERKIVFLNLVLSMFAGISQHFVIEEMFLATNWAFLGNGNINLSILTTLVCSILFGSKKFKSIFLFMAGLEHYSYIFKKILVLISSLVFLIFAFSLPGGRNFVLVCFLWQTLFWLVTRRIVSKWVRLESKGLRVLIFSDKTFVSEYFNKSFTQVSVVRSYDRHSFDYQDFDIVLFHNFVGLDMSHFVFIAELQRKGVTTGYISNEIRLQGWSGIQVLVGPHLMMINSSYHNSLVIHIWKRFFDLLCTSIILILIAPAVVFLSTVLYLINGSPVLYGQERVGRNGKAFRILKYRTYKNGNLSANLTSKVKDSWVKKPNPDELVTLGGWLRRWSIDELPQLINVLLGQMSLVGPRPRLANETNQNYQTASPIFTMGLKPGITGLWQISGRNEIDPEFALVLDKYYVDNWNPFFDVQIIIKTLSAIRNGIGAK